MLLNENAVLIVGSLAATLTTVAFVPQVIKTHKAKHTKDLSLIMFVLLSLGLFLWIVYGFALWSFPVIIANIITLGMSLYLLYLKIKYG
ncbi:MAG: SemiSWEET transporter [Candidatus Margulisiibacteriota bacterium]